MTNQHPLTDEMCEGLVYFRLISQHDYIGMRAAADWQLEQVFQAWDQCMDESVNDLQFIFLFSKKLKAMRPTNTQESN